MSAEYFRVEEVNNPSKFYDDYDKEEEHSRGDQVQSRGAIDSDCYSVSTKRSQDSRLHEIEEQLQMAESRCNTLKGQLDYMKRVYHKASSNETTVHNSRKQGNKTPPKRKTSDSFSPPTYRRQPSSGRQPKEYEGSSKSRELYSSSFSKIKSIDNYMPPKRQNSRSISTDTTGAAVRTINNILTGITDSVNRLSEMHAHLGSEGRKSRSSSTRRRTNRGMEVPEPVIGVEVVNFIPKGKENKNLQKKSSGETEISDPSIIEEITNKSSEVYSIKSKTSHKKKPKFKLNRPMTTKMQSSSGSINIKKKTMKVMAKHVEKKLTLNPVKTGMIDIEATSTISANKKPKKQIKRFKISSKTTIRRRSKEMQEEGYQPYNCDRLVELYHNKAAKESDSDESNKENYGQNKSRQKAGGDEIIPPLKIDVSLNLRKDEAEYKKQLKENNKEVLSLSPIEENDYSEPAAPRTECSNMCSTYSKNYELPTISSKMKQVAKCYLNSFNFKSIPFCAAKSTTPSHNIGINIQQVMSIIKTRQPLNGISPTLAHNIGLAAEKLHNGPLTTLVSSMSSRMWYGRSQCPLVLSSMNYQQLQEMAKEIPEEDETANGDCPENNGGSNAVVINGPSGDAEKNEKDQMVWTVDPLKSRNCTCVNQQGLGFQQVLSKYHTNQPPATTYSGSQVHYNMPPLKHYRMPKRQYMQALRNRSTSQTPLNTSNIAEPEASTSEAPLKGKEKTLKEVLKNLHNDFDGLNSKYEELSAQAREGKIETNEETLRELEKMEKSLNNKEEEIKMVMALYKEVLALKQQVKTLKERTSQASFPVREQLSRFREYKDPTAALHLTKLLRQIKNYQMNYKKGVNMY